MAGVAQLLFGGGQQQAPAPFIFNAASPGPQPEPPKDNSAEIEEAKRKERVAAQAGVSRGSTILTDFALATTAPSVLKKTLGGV